MRQQTLARARSTVEALLHRQCADTTLSVLSVNPDSLARIRLKDRLRTELQDADIEAFPVVSFIAESEVGEEPV